jgi:LmbE family N-acetylglucosaminyl deacetylase
MPERVLVVAAHPDDEVLGCGATIARLAGEGAEVVIAILGEGITSRYADRADADSQLLAELRKHGSQAAGVLGAAEVSFHDLPDNRFDTVPMLDVVKLVEGLVERFDPATVYTHHAGDLNIDHGVVHRAVLTATRPMRGGRVRRILAFEVPSSTDWAFNGFAPAFRPSVFVDVTATIDRKLEAMRAYETETRPFPHPRSDEALVALARHRGSTVGFEAAEAFELVRELT